MRVRRAAVVVAAALAVASGCGGVLVRLASDQQWEELDRRARAMKQPPRGKAARAWAEALVELGDVEEARAVLLRDFRNGGQEPSLLALAELERSLGLRGIAAAHHTRLINIDLDTVADADAAAAICELLRARARAEAELGEALAADADMRRVALACPSSIDDEDRGFLASLSPQAQAQAQGQRTLDASLSPTPEARAALEDQLRERLEVARKRSPRALIAVAEAERIELEPDDVAMLLAAEFAGALGPGFVSSRRLSAWIGNNEVAAVVAAIDTLPDGAREYALLRLAGVRSSERLADDRDAWIVAAMSSVAGQGPQEAAKAWRVAASVGDLNGAEFALNTNLRDMIPVELPPEDAPTLEKTPAQIKVAPKGLHWSRRVPVDRRSFDLLLTLARLFELREQPVLALELRRSVIVAGYEVGLAQVGPAAAEEVLRQLALGRPWQALAVAEVVPGPLVEEVLPALASALALADTVGLDEALEADRNVVWRALGDPWFETWTPRLAATTGGLDLQDAGAGHRCPELAQWLDPAQAPALTAVGLDPERSREALVAALDDLGAPATGAALARALESALALACSAPLINLLHAGPHALTIETLDERLTHAPELAAATQLQLVAELALAAGLDKRALLLTTSAAAQSVEPRAIWARAATAGRSFGAREYTLEALRQVVLHSDGLDDPAARREMLLTILRDVDHDEILRDGGATLVDSIRAQIRAYLDEAPTQRRWARLDELLWALASEPRADALAWTRLLELVVDDEVAARHPAAVAALERAAASAAEAAPAAGDATMMTLPELAYLSDADAVCEVFGEPEPLDRQRLLGVATACPERQRAEALARLATDNNHGEDHGEALRAAILDGPIAAEIGAEIGDGALRSVPALGREGLSLRVAFGLPLDPVWITEARRR